jgi:hypothetical protein
MSAQATSCDRTASNKARAVQERSAADRWVDWFAPITFGLFVTSLITILVLAYAGVPLV